MVLEGVLVQYKFSLPKPLKLSSYGYQKLFRALYGYTQCVHKANKKKYAYFRPGVLFFSPYIRVAKNTVIIPKEELQKLVSFFRSGENPTHKWVKRGDWKATYYIDERKLKPADVVQSIEDLLERYYITKNTKKLHLSQELSAIDPSTDKAYLKLVVNEAKSLASREWFKETYNLSDKLRNFKKNFQKAHFLVK